MSARVITFTDRVRRLDAGEGGTKVRFRLEPRILTVPADEPGLLLRLREAADRDAVVSIAFDPARGRILGVVRV